jgi:hypothetical protein
MPDDTPAPDAQTQPAPLQLQPGQGAFLLGDDGMQCAVMPLPATLTITAEQMDDVTEHWVLKRPELQARILRAMHERVKAAQNALVVPDNKTVVDINRGKRKMQA